MSITIRPLPETDIDEAVRIFRLAFGTFVGLPDPMQFGGDADFIRPRWRANPQALIGAYDGSKLVGSNFATRWGRFGFLGPLTVLPEYWEKGVGQALLAETISMYGKWGTELVSLFTFPQSTKHLYVYQKFGFWPQSLTPVMAKTVGDQPMPQGAAKFAALTPERRDGALDECRDLANEIYPGLDLTSEISAVEKQSLGDTLLVYRNGQIGAFAVCHAGKNTEAGSDTVYVKFAAVRPVADAEQGFDLLLDTCEAYAAQKGMKTLLAGTNTARIEAYQRMLRRGFRARMHGVAMQRPHTLGTLKAGYFVLDDWR